jgi:hypothetical protein
MQELNNGLRERAQWFRIGMISATTLTPLVTRWRSLRTAERARELWESRRSEVALPWTERRTVAKLPPAARNQQVSTGIWLAGAGLGLIVAGTVAFVVARRRILASDEAPLELTLEPGSNGAARSFGERTREVVSRVLPAGRAAATPRRETVTEDAGDTAPRMPAVGAADSATPEDARFVGDVKTLVYHEAGDDNLPAEDNRVYFANRVQAESAGFRPVKGEVAR